MKSTIVYYLLNNKQLFEKLNLKISPQNCVLILGESKDRILMQDDMRHPVSHYSSTDVPSVCFRIMMLITILKYDDQTQLQIPIWNRDLTVDKLLEMTGLDIGIYKYLASNETYEMISNNQNLSTLNIANFILAKENETCVIRIEQVQEIKLIDIENDEMIGRYVVCATIADICKRNNIDMNHQHLLYSDDFVPGMNTLLASFQAEILHFKLIDNKLPVTITITNDEEKQTITFNCSISMTIKRLCQIACQLLGVNIRYYGLMDGECELDDSMSLDDIDSSKIDYELKMNCTATLKSRITYEDQTVTLPCDDITLLSTILEEVSGRFHIPESHHRMYEFIVMDDGQTQIDLDTSIGDARSLFPEGTALIPLQLRKTNE